jgi:hypothetical protein
MRLLPILLLCSMLTGCLAVASPRVNVTPAITVNAPDVRAFRVTEKETFFGLMGWPKGVVLVNEIPVENGVVPRHRDCFVSHFVMFCLVSHWHDQSDSVRLYRRGYETVVIPSNRLCKAIGNWTPIEVAWKKAETLAAREKAIGDIHRPFGGMQEITREKTAFIAEEYSALAESPLAASVELAPQRLRRMAQKFIDGTPPAGWTIED